MVETDWKELLNYSHKELKAADKEKLCENISWMEADDIELNFSDLKSLFRLAQDILKFKSDQVNNLFGQLDTLKRKYDKAKEKIAVAAKEDDSSSNVQRTLTHQEELIHANKEIIEQLNLEIESLESRKSDLDKEGKKSDADSESSRDALSEIDAIADLENEVLKKNKHIRKLLSDVKLLQDENMILKEKLTVFKDKLKESAQLIENLTEQLTTITRESAQLRVTLGKCEEDKTRYNMDLDILNKKLCEKNSKDDLNEDDFKARLQQLKEIVKVQKTEISKLHAGYIKQREELARLKSSNEFYTQYKDQEVKINELQNKLAEASNQMIETAEIINVLKDENIKLKKNTVTTPTKKSISDKKTDTGHGTDKEIISSLEKIITKLKYALQGSDEMLALREKELSEITSQLQILQTDEGIKKLLSRLKNNKRQMKIKDEGIQSLVQEVNSLHQLVNDLQVEYEIIRQKFNIPVKEKLATRGFLSEYYLIKKQHQHFSNEIRAQKNKLTAIEMDSYIKTQNVSKLIIILKNLGYTEDTLEKILNDDDPITNNNSKKADEANDGVAKTIEHNSIEFQSILEENEGLRNSLTEILNYLKDNSTTTSGILTLECPSLDAVLQSMEARRSAGWFAPHMKTILELRTALGGRDALLMALHESRKETYEVMNQLAKETKKCVELENELTNIKSNNLNDKEPETIENEHDYSAGEFGPWILDAEYNNIDLLDKTQLQNFIAQGDVVYEQHVKHCLFYFTRKFKMLYENFTLLTTNIANDKKHWFNQEEKYKDQIENLKSQLNECVDDEISDKSPGVVNECDNYIIKSKYNYLDENYKNIRNLYENIRNKLLESKEELMLLTSDYEEKVQKLMLSQVDLIERIRGSVPLELFWQQNATLNNISLKYRHLLTNNVSGYSKSIEFQQLLKSQKDEIINEVKTYFTTEELDGKENTMQKMLVNSIDNDQFVLMTKHLENKDTEIQRLNNIISELQKSQSEFINKVSSSMTNEETTFIKESLQNATLENRVLKERCRELKTELDRVFSKMQAYTQCEMSNEKELNMLRHQILDLQMPGQSTAAISRLSNEILLAHLQRTENLQNIESLKLSLNTERQLRIDAEEMLAKQQKVFNVYVSRYKSKFRNMFEIMEILRQQYQGVLPLVSIENYLNTVDDMNNKNKNLTEKLAEVEDLRNGLMTKHSVYDQIYNLSKCLDDECSCSYKIKFIMMEKMKLMEAEHFGKKLEIIEKSRITLLDRYNSLEKNIILINQGFKVTRHGKVKENISHKDGDDSLEVEEMCSDGDTSQKDDATYTLLKSPSKDHKNVNITTRRASVTETRTVYTQTFIQHTTKEHKEIQLDEDQYEKQLKLKVENFMKEKIQRDKELNKTVLLNKKQEQEIKNLNNYITELAKANTELETKVRNLTDTNRQKDMLFEQLQDKTENLKKQALETKSNHFNQVKWQSEANQEKATLMLSMKKIESDKNKIIEEYKILIQNEREEYGKLINDLQFKLRAVQAQLDQRGSDVQLFGEVNIRESFEKQDLNVTELQDKCFKINSDLETCESELKTCRSEVERWKNLASERLTKMEMLSSQIKERHNQEVESYKAENQHWLMQLNETQREHMELRTTLTEQKANHMKQLAEKDAHIEHLRAVVNNLKTQIMNMQTVISINDPSFDLSAIVEVEEVSDAISRQDSDTLELRFESSSNLNDAHDDLMKLPSSSTAIWQEPLIERLRREKQLMSKQNAILRKQIKALAGRERRARLDAQNLKNQVFRISTSGQKVPSAESAALQNKIASLQAQLTSARRDANSTVALWDKWKRAQQTSERWQARHEEKCQEIMKLESSLNLAKSAISRLEKEKRMLLSRLSESRSDKQLAIEKHNEESSEKLSQARHEYCESPPPLLAKTLLERIEAQQRRIVALEMAEKGNEPLVSEYEKSLAAITSLKGQVLKLESSLLEAQIKSPLRSDKDNQPELEYWKSYCEMLKEENLQLTLRINSLESTPAPVDHQRVNDLQQTVLTLRGLVSKLQADQKSAASGHKRCESRPTSGRSTADKSRNQVESYKTEISNLKRSIYEKDLLLENSKEMLKIAADREEDLLRENTFLRRRLEELSENRTFLSA